MTRAAQAGFTLIELVISIVLVSVATAGVLLAFITVTRGSADPQRVQQAVAVAEAYLEEIRTQPVADPDGSDAGETRADFDDLLDYDGLGPEPPTDQTGTVIGGTADLSAYSVEVAVAAAAAPELGPTGAQVPAAATYRIDVRVRRGAEIDFTLTAYRATY